MLGEAMAELGLAVALEHAFPLAVDGRTRCWLYPDLVVDTAVVVECKVTADWLSDANLAQVLTYLVVCQLPVGVLINFGLPKLEYRRILPPKRPTEWIRRVAPYLRRNRW
jgi:GxxExxY protein